MLINRTKNFILYLVYLQKYSYAKIAIGSRIKNTKILDQNIVIGRYSYLTESTIKNHVLIKNNCFIDSCHIENQVTINDNCSIYNSQLNNNVVINNNCSVHTSKLSNNIIIYPNSQVSNTVIGDFSYLASNGRLNLVKCGKFCSLGPDLIMGHGEHPTDFISTSPVFFSTMKQCGTSFSSKDYFKECKTTTIGNDVWIGARVFIQDGIKIGNGAIIAAGAIVVKDVPDYAIVGGVPARIIRYRFSEDVIQQLLNIKWWEWEENKIIQAQPFFTNSNIDVFLEWVSSTENVIASQ